VFASEPTFFPEAATAPAPINEFIWLGAEQQIEKIEIHWPSGLKQEIMVPAVDRIFSVGRREGDCSLIKLRRDLSKLD